jgi:RNA polymerase sigma-70 factor (ECF subfamily)
MRDSPLALTSDTPSDPPFDWVFGTYRTLVYRLALGLLGNAHDAEDVTQEVFLRVYKALPGYQAERAGLRTWVTTIAVNACQTHRRRNFWRRWGQPLPTANGADADEELPLIDPSAWVAPEDQAMLADLRAVLRDELARLKPEHRAVLILHYYLDYSSSEIAQITNSSEGTVCSRLYYARHRLQARLESRAAAAGQPGGQGEWV